MQFIKGFLASLCRCWPWHHPPWGQLVKRTRQNQQKWVFLVWIEKCACFLLNTETLQRGWQVGLHSKHVLPWRHKSLTHRNTLQICTLILWIYLNKTSFQAAPSILKTIFKILLLRRTKYITPSKFHYEFMKIQSTEKKGDSFLLK